MVPGLSPVKTLIEKLTSKKNHLTNGEAASAALRGRWLGTAAGAVLVMAA